MIDKNYILEKTDLPLSVNVIEKKVQQFVPDAIEKLIEILPAALYAALQTLSAEKVKDWSKTNSYVLDNKVVHVENGLLKMWKSLTTNSNSEPTTANSTDWLELQLGTFLVSFVQPYMAHHVFYAYAVNGGVNVSHQGLQQITNETAQALTGKNLQAYLNYWQGRRESKRQRMFNYLDDKTNVLDTVSYTAVDPARKKHRFQIRAIGINPRRDDRDTLSDYDRDMYRYNNRF
jgi:hypothetical protein